MTLTKRRDSLKNAERSSDEVERNDASNDLPLQEHELLNQLPKLSPQLSRNRSHSKLLVTLVTDDLLKLKAELEEQRKKLKEVPLSRYLTFLLYCAPLLGVATYIEGSYVHPEENVKDWGFIITRSLNTYLKERPFLCDVLAALNSVYLLFFMLIYGTLFRILMAGDWGVGTRILTCAMLRVVCGTITVLPVSKEYIASNYDFPEGLFFMLGLAEASTSDSQPFISFFSGHVANAVIIADDAAKQGYSWISWICYVGNFFQILRLLCTRGHYTIDLIMGYIVAYYVIPPKEIGISAIELDRMINQRLQTITLDETMFSRDDITEIMEGFVKSISEKQRVMAGKANRLFDDIQTQINHHTGNFQNRMKEADKTRKQKWSDAKQTMQDVIDGIKTQWTETILPAMAFTPTNGSSALSPTNSLSSSKDM